MKAEIRRGRGHHPTGRARRLALGGRAGAAQRRPVRVHGRRLRDVPREAHGDAEQHVRRDEPPVQPDRRARRRDARVAPVVEDPPGPVEGPFEFVELRGDPNLLLTNLYFVVVDGNTSSNPGMASLVINLSSVRLGSSGLLVIGGFNSPYPIPFGTAFLPDSRFDVPAGTLPNETVSFLLITSAKPILIIAHRVTTLKDCSDIYRFDDRGGLVGVAYKDLAPHSRDAVAAGI